jgi:hypothetical protein
MRMMDYRGRKRAKEEVKRKYMEGEEGEENERRSF